MIRAVPGLGYTDEAARRRRRNRILAVGGIVAVVGAVTAAALIALTSESSEAEATLDRFLDAFEAREYATAAAETDGPPEEVTEALAANVEGLDDATLEAEVTEVEEGDGEARATVAYEWQVPGIGAFAYANGRIRIGEQDGEWRLRWAEHAVHPRLDAGERLGTEREMPERAPILDRDGDPIVRPRPVVEVGVIPGELEGRRAAIAAIGELTGADPKALRRSVAAAEAPTNFVPAITLRPGDVDPIRDELEAIPGISLGERELPLAPTREFARALLGTVGPITAEQLEELGEPYEAGDLVGQGGLQGAFEDRLAGTPTHRIVVRDAAGVAQETLLEREGESGQPLETTLDPPVQAAAEEALAGIRSNAALVAIEPASGDVLAVANRPLDEAFNRAFEGRYPPGSTFKVISTAGLLEAGLDPDETVHCPATIEVGGREFRNFEGGAAGAVPFTTDFAESCNTAFVSLAERLEPEALRETAALFGLGSDHELGVPAYLGNVPHGRDEVEHAAAMIGQARILASPLAMAGVAATVAAGRWHAPRILASDPSESGPPLPAETASTLRELMRLVVTSGTGAALVDVTGEPIGKSGTAEFGSGDPPPTHAWFIAARDDLAVAVLVEDAPSGGEVAAPIAADLLATVGG